MYISLLSWRISISLPSLKILVGLVPPHSSTSVPIRAHPTRLRGAGPSPNGRSSWMCHLSAECIMKACKVSTLQIVNTVTLHTIGWCMVYDSMYFQACSRDIACAVKQYQLHINYQHMPLFFFHNYILIYYTRSPGSVICLNIQTCLCCSTDPQKT